MSNTRAAQGTDESDEELALRAKTGDDEAIFTIISRYKNYVKARARTYYLVGADREDIIQEGMIGLYKAVRDYNPDRMSSFRAFADLCVTRQMITAVKTATRQKHMPLNSYVSLNRPAFEDTGDRTIMDTALKDPSGNPEDLMISREEYDYMGEMVVKTLSEFERTVLQKYLEGKSYQEIANELEKQVKSVDNALQRIKRKVEKRIKKLDGEEGEN